MLNIYNSKIQKALFVENTQYLTVDIHQKD